MSRIQKNDYQNKTRIDKITKGAFFIITLFCASIIFFIVLFIFIRGIKPFINTYQVGDSFYRVNFWQFMTGTIWFQAPNIYGIGFIVINTLYVVGLSIVIAVPISILTALFVSRVAPKIIGKVITAVIELLAAIPSIIYGLFGMGVITNFVKNMAKLVHYQSAGGLSTFATIIVLAIMIIPTITMISITSIKAVKKDVIDASLALGASPTQTNFKVVLKGAQSGIFSGIILGVGRALGEATAVSMVAGNNGSGPTFNLFDTTRTLTSTMLLGLKETTGLDYDIRFSVGIILIGLILGVNFLLSLVKRRLSQ
ncbi:MAG: phosphate ABC transporter permease subunit PstC [Bacilli bacterium]|nr:phosphate ABC transporter permease subunit PstC [Bacilli bacterium]